MVSAIDGKGICYAYEDENGDIPALENVDISVEEGELATILGENGSGKSTLVKHFDALLPLQQGKLCVAGIDVRQQKRIWQLRRICSMVFQNPDNQFVSPLVKEDIAFGLENYGVPAKEIPGKIRRALHQVDMDGAEERPVSTLSGGQKQRIAVAAVLVLDPKIVIFDEATAMLDPEGRREILRLAEKLHGKAHKTVIMITHYVEEAAIAQKVFVLHRGTVLAQGSPQRILSDRALLAKAGLVPPVSVRIYYDLLAAGIKLESCPITEKALEEQLCRYY